jgi:predicted ATP-binding protein involved in virulence
LLGEERQADDLSICLESEMGDIEAYFRIDNKQVDRPRVHASYEGSAAGSFTELMNSNDVAPVMAFYREDRAYMVPENRRPPFQRSLNHDRRSAYVGAFGGRLVYEDAVKWFEEIESAELREQRERGEEYRDPRLVAVRSAVERTIQEVSNLRMVGLPPRLALTLKAEGQHSRVLKLSQLSSGFRVMVTLVMDLARRMADLNPHLPDPLDSPGVVLIDEIDLHLHPRWQQLVVSGLSEAFPNVQFILTTHSPQVLTTLMSENVVKLNWTDGILKLEHIPSTEGAESGRLLAEAMDVSERPPPSVSKFVSLLERYLDRLRKGDWESSEAQSELRAMQELSPDDPVLSTLELEQRRLTARRRA